MGFAEPAGARFLRHGLVWALVLLAGCASSPKPPPEPALRKQALAAETDGARRYTRGDYSGAVRRFAEASRLQQGLDDGAAVARNRLNQAQAELALGQPQAAFDHAGEVSENALAVLALQVQVQASLALGRIDAAKGLLTRMETLCTRTCPERGSLLVLGARVALADGNARQALADAEAALPLLHEQQEERETANAWRLVAAARMALAEIPTALTAAQTALGIDRQLALPEKIARDWLLIGDIHRRGGGSADAQAAYQRALAVAQAAGLDDVVILAAEALTEKTR